MSEPNANGFERSHADLHGDPERLRQAVHDIVTRVPCHELKAALIALVELAVSAQVRGEAAENAS